MIPVGPDLLIVGGLAVDRLADGSTAAGGTVTHATRAAAAAGWRVATITAAGPEPEAVAALGELRGLGPCRVTAAATSIRFAIHDGGPRRQLVFECAGRKLAVDADDVADLAPRAVLLAPIAAELQASAIRASATVPVRVSALQGWLRRLVPGEDALPLPLAALGEELSAALGDLDALVASDEDLAGVSSDPRGRLAALRAYFGARPLLVVTAGADGAWLDDPSNGIHHLPVASRLDAGSTIGAGDAFAGLLTAEMGAGHGVPDATAAAMRGASDYIASRR